MAVMDEQGQIQIHTENIFPIIKKAVYSGHEVFLRELAVSYTHLTLPTILLV